MKKLLALISLCLAAAMILPVCAFAADGDAVLSFRDVKADEWYYENVRYVYENGIMKGTSDTEFSPEGTLTRAMCVTILHRAAGQGRKQDPSQRVSESRAVTSFQRLDDEFAVFALIAGHFGGDAGFFHFDQNKPSLM